VGRQRALPEESRTSNWLVRDSSAVRRLFFLLEPWDVRKLYIRKTADLPFQLLVGTFPRFVAIGFYFPSEIKFDSHKTWKCADQELEANPLFSLCRALWRPTASWLSDFIFYKKPLYESFHQSFFYSFITFLALRKWCYTPLQHDFALDPIIPPFDFHFRIYKRDLAI
jgi:hypothetical protein